MGPALKTRDSEYKRHEINRVPFQPCHGIANGGGSGMPLDEGAEDDEAAPCCRRSKGVSESSNDQPQTEAVAPALKPAISVDASIMGDNVLDIANFTIAKYEFENANRSPEVREEAINRMKGTMW